MAVAVRSSTTQALGNRASSTLTAPAGLANDDILFAIIAAGDGNDQTAPAVTPPAGFNTVTGNPYQISKADPYAIGYNLFWKKAASESGSYVFTHGTADTESRLIAFTGADLTAPVSPNPTTNNGLSNVATALGITPTVNNSFVLWISCSWNGLASITPPTGTTPTFTDIHDTGGVLYVSGGVLATAAATGNKTATVQPAGGDPWRASLVVIQAAGAAVAPVGKSLILGQAGIRAAYW